MPSMIPNWNEDLVFEGVNYIMDSSNGTLFDPRTEKKVGWWEANYGYGGPAGCEGYVTWVDHYAKDRHDVDVSRSLDPKVCPSPYRLPDDRVPSQSLYWMRALC